MTYGLAKKLKDARYVMDYNLDGFSEYDKKTAYIDIVLSELIEACGDEFDSLEKRGNVYFAFGSSKDKTMMKIDPYRGGGMTLEEAAADLWLALNDKKTQDKTPPNKV